VNNDLIDPVEYILPHLEQVEQWVGDGMDKQRIIEHLPAYPETIRAEIDTIIASVIERLKVQPITINHYHGPAIITTVSDSECGDITIAPPAAAPETPKPKKLQKVHLDFQLIEDNNLKFTDRIIFSLLWKWAYGNRDETDKSVSIRAIQRFTGFRKYTISESIAKLQSLKYLENHTPLVTRFVKSTDKDGKNHYSYTLNNGKKWLGYKEDMRWLNDGDCKYHVFQEFVRLTDYKKVVINYLAKCLGINRRTVYNYVHDKNKKEHIND
jgi:hypothetical protein